MNLRVRFDFPSSINFIDINGFAKYGPKTLIKGYPRGSKVVPLDFYGYDSILVINCIARLYLAPFPNPL